MDNYRIKTENEFIRYFGDNWRSDVPRQWNSAGRMDFLFGLSVPQNISASIFKYGSYSYSGWEISKEMLIKYDPVPMIIDEDGNIC